MDFENSLRLASRQRDVGRLDKAESICKQLLAERRDARALHLLAAIQQQLGRHDLALPLLREAIETQPDQAHFWHDLGASLRVAGELPAAIHAIFHATELSPASAPMHLSLGTALLKCGDNVGAADALARAASLDPKLPDIHFQLGNLFISLGRHAAAVEALRAQSLRTPTRPDVFNGLGFALQFLGRYEEAGTAFARCVKLKPDHAQALNNLGAVQYELARYEDAINTLLKAVKLNPVFAEAHNNLGKSFRALGLFDAAMASLSNALRLRPNYTSALINIGNLQASLGEREAAVASFEKAIQSSPNFTDAHNNLGNTLVDERRYDDAVAVLSRAIELDSANALAHNNLGNALKELGRIEEAMAAYERAITLMPTAAEIHSNLVFAAHLNPAYDAKAILREEQRWDRQHAQPLKLLIRPHDNDRSPQRRLRVGYVSPDFRVHAVSQFMFPLIENHNRQAVEVFCYSDNSLPDVMTERVQVASDVWRETARLAPATLAELIRQDRIDVLVDLALHTAHNRLTVFARKPAPVQITYLGMPAGTGVEGIDYRLTDVHMDPPGTNDELYVERLLRLPDTYWCYPGDPDSPDVSSLPALTNDEITFGCLTNFCKVSGPTLETWADLMRAVPRSRLLLYAHEGSARQRVSETFRQFGIDPARVHYVGFLPADAYLRVYERIDIVLDPFPYGGGTTICDALWMGLPVVCLAGQTGVSRGGFSLLTNVGLADLAAPDRASYVRTAAALAENLDRLATVRSGLRERLVTSPVMDIRRFTANIEVAYRTAWMAYCDKAETQIS